MLDKRLGTNKWVPISRQVVNGSHIITFPPDGREPEIQSAAVVRPDMMSVWVLPWEDFLVDLEAPMDVDGDGQPEALITAVSGAAHRFPVCLFVRLGKRPSLLGGFDAHYAPGGAATDLDGDGRMERETLDDSFITLGPGIRESPWLPFVYSYRNGRFVDLTTKLRGREIRKLRASNRDKALRRPDNPGVGALVLWYTSGVLLGEGDRTLQDMRRSLAPDAMESFEALLPKIRHSLQERKGKLWTGEPPPLD